jgi:hypothetical protein
LGFEVAACGAARESLINGSLISCASSRSCIAYRDHR